jgi:hypothetical protein
LKVAVIETDGAEHRSIRHSLQASGDSVTACGGTLFEFVGH